MHARRALDHCRERPSPASVSLTSGPNSHRPRKNAAHGCDGKRGAASVRPSKAGAGGSGIAGRRAARGPFDRRPALGPSQQFHGYFERYLIVPQIKQLSAATVLTSPIPRASIGGREMATTSRARPLHQTAACQFDRPTSIAEATLLTHLRHHPFGTPAICKPR
jgi:hypothetical protein